MEIKPLSPEVVDQIAAGEVVERPSHMVKELAENSIDAGATKLIIEVSEGGRRVQVTDNGRGMSKEDLSLALERFATSKITEANDLWKLSTFGFRGEALASIASVSSVVLTSRIPKAEVAWKLTSSFGKKSEVVSVGGGFGTTISIQDLFKNIPARLKFLRTDAGEMAAVRNTVKALALSHPSVEIRYSENGKLYAFWPACENRLSRVTQVLQIDKMYEGQAQRENVRAHAVFADPKTVGKTSKNIWIFVQNRWVQDRSIQAAVMEAYRNLLMHGEFPQVAVWVETDPDFVDVNIHPTKSQVKFQDSSLAFRAVQAAIRNELEKAPWVPQQMTRTAIQPLDVNQTFNFQPSNLNFDDPVLQKTQFKQKEFYPQEIVRQPPDPFSIPTQSFDKKGESLDSRGWGDSSTPSLDNNHEKLPSRGGYWSKLQLIGQSHLTYLVCQTDDALVLVDQHAAHERVVFEKMMAAWRGGKVDVQEYLFPLAIDLSPERMEAIQPYLKDLEKMGLYIESLGPSTIGIKAAPLLLKESALTKALDKMSTEIYENGGSFSIEKYVADICATMACHSVVRAGQAMSIEEMQSLLQEMDEFPLSSFCPHGRPVSIEYPFVKIEKEFGRLV